VIQERAEDRLAWLRGAVIAHRGLHDMARSDAHWVENTLSAFACAIAAGYGIECDVRLAGDGTVVVFHDDTLDRLTHATGPVKAHGMEVLSRLPIAGTRDVIPTLAQLLDLVRGQVPLLIEIKLDKREDPAPLAKVWRMRWPIMPGRWRS
jgi:glycerophosphoryl diester phosphodiesterase